MSNERSRATLPDRGVNVEREKGADDVGDRPVLAPNVRLIGELQDSGFTEQQWLIERDGHFIQLTELLYRVAEQADGRRDLDEIARAMTDKTEWTVTSDDVRELIRRKLAPSGIIAGKDGRSAYPTEHRRPPSPLGVGMRKKTIGPRVLDPVTRIVRFLYAPPLAIPILCAVAVAHWWLYFVHGIEASVVQVLYSPVLVLILLPVLLVAALFHELGHASALRYGGGKVRAIGVGFYLIYPVFYTDVTDSYRLGRWARVRTGLGGFYFHLIFALGLMAVSQLWGHEFLLVGVLLINAEIARQLIPFLRLDGYWVLCDLTGIPDLLSQMAPFIARLFGGRWKGTKLPALRPWVKRVFAIYTIVTIPVLVGLFVLMVTRAPQFITAAWDSVQGLASIVAGAQGHRDWAGMALGVIQIIILALPVVGIVFFTVTLVRSVRRLASMRATLRRSLA